MNDADAEVELKLALVKGRLSRAQDLVGHVERWDRTSIEDVYFDTPQATLRNRGLVLRLRRDGERWLQTLKSAGSGRSLVPVRGEWEVALPAGPAPNRLDLERFDVAALRVLMRGGLDTSALVPVFRSRVTRRRALVQHGESRIEVALDSGRLSTSARGRKCALKVSELELELKSGRATDLLDVGARVVKQRHGITLVPALRSKAERGYALAAEQGLPAERASARSFGSLIDPAMTSADALRAVIRHGIALVVANADAMRISPADEHIHQARVAIRRMRSAIRLFDPAGDDLPPALGDGLHELAHLLGTARDWDVIVAETLPDILGTQDAEVRTGTGLQRAAEQQRARNLKRAIAAVSSRSYARLILRLARWTATASPARDVLVANVAAPLLERAADRLFKDAVGFGELGRHKQHRVRIHAKRLRYALDLLAVALPSRGAADYTDGLALLQDSLGELNDAAVAREHLAELASSRDEKRTVDGWYRHRRPVLAEQAAKQIAALARRPRPWSLI